MCAPRWAPRRRGFYGDPTAELRVVGITGTNGKTTTAFLVRHLLEAAGRQCGLLGTVKRVVGGVEEEVERTTPEAIDLQATFRRMLDEGDAACAMEVSSHALELGRASGIRFACKVFTNLTQDHLDFHETMEAYFLAKRRLFDEPGTAGGERRRRVRPAAGRGARRRGDLRHRPRGRLPRPRRLLRRARARASPARRPTGPSRSARRCRASSTSRTRWPRSRRSRTLGVEEIAAWRASAACPAGSSPWTRARTSACSWTTRTRPTRSRTCCARRAR